MVLRAGDGVDIDGVFGGDAAEIGQQALGEPAQAQRCAAPVERKLGWPEGWAARCLNSEGLKELLTVEEAADRLKLVPKTVRKLCRSRSLTAVNIQRRWRIPVSAIEEFLRARASLRV